RRLRPLRLDADDLHPVGEADRAWYGHRLRRIFQLPQLGTTRVQSLSGICYGSRREVPLSRLFPSAGRGARCSDQRLKSVTTQIQPIGYLIDARMARILRRTRCQSSATDVVGACADASDMAMPRALTSARSRRRHAGEKMP